MVLLGKKLRLVWLLSQRVLAEVVCADDPELCLFRHVKVQGAAQIAEAAAAVERILEVVTE